MAVGQGFVAHAAKPTQGSGGGVPMPATIGDRRKAPPVMAGASHGVWLGSPLRDIPDVAEPLSADCRAADAG